VHARPSRFSGWHSLVDAGEETIINVDGDSSSIVAIKIDKGAVLGVEEVGDKIAIDVNSAGDDGWEGDELGGADEDGAVLLDSSVLEEILQSEDCKVGGDDGVGVGTGQVVGELDGDSGDRGGGGDGGREGGDGDEDLGHHFEVCLGGWFGW